MPYSSTHEITLAVESAIREAVISEKSYVMSTIVSYPQQTLVCRDVTEQDIEAKLMISKVGSPPLDILIRTSGVKRLSDYMLWQVGMLLLIDISSFILTDLGRKCCEDTQLHMLTTYWPDMSFWELVPVVLDYQRKVWAGTRGK